MPDQSTRRYASGFSLVELLIVMGVIAIVMAIAVPVANQIFMGANETAVLREIATLHTAQAQYHSQFGNFAASLSDLGPAGSGRRGQAGAGLIPRSLAKGKKDGFTFVLQATADGYVLNVAPTTYEKSGRRSFYSDETMVVRCNLGPEPATADSPEVGEK